MFYSQNKELYLACDQACRNGNVSKAKELLDRGAHVNYHHPDQYNVSIVSGHMQGFKLALARTPEASKI